MTTTSTHFIPGTVVTSEWLNAVDASTFDDQFNVKRWGAVGDDVTDDTAAIQAAINAAILVNGQVVIPPGTYKISSTLQVFMTGFSQGIDIVGIGGGAALTARATLRWYGNAPTGYVLHLRGVCQSRVSNLNIQFSNLTSFPFLGGLYVETGQPYGGPPSSGVVLEYMNITGGIGTNSCAVRIGHNNQQVSEVSCKKIIAQAGDNGVSYVTEYGFIIDGANNTKDMTFMDCSLLQNQVAGVFYTPAASGWNTWINTGGGDNAVDFWIQGSGMVQLIGGGSENSGSFLKQVGGGRNHGSIYVSGWKAEQLTSANAVEILGCANLEMHSCFFSPQTGTTPRYIKFGDALLSDLNADTFANFLSTSNLYKYAVNSLPVWNYGLVGTTYTSSTLAPVHIQSIGDRGTDSSEQVVRLVDIIGTSPYKFKSKSRVGSDWASTRALPQTAYTPSLPVSCHKITIPFTYLKAASTTTTIGILDVEALGKVIGAYAIVTSTFVLGASTISFSLGDLAGTSTEFLLSTTISTGTPARGNVDGHLGTALARATAVQGGYTTLTVGHTIGAKFTSSAGNLGNGTTTNLTDGSITIYVLVQDFE